MLSSTGTNVRNEAAPVIVNANQAEDWSIYLGKTSEPSHMLSQLALSGSIARVSEIDVAEIIKLHPEGDVHIKDSRAAGYGLVPLAAEYSEVSGGVKHPWPNRDEVDYEIWFDAPVGIGLTFQEKPIAVSSCGVGKNGEVTIYQMQGVTGRKIIRDETGMKINDSPRVSPRGLAPVNWRKLCISLADMFAREIAAPGVAIQSADNNRWVDRWLAPGETGEHCISYAAAVKNYDLPAILNGFSREDDNNWHRPVSSSPAASLVR